MRSCLIFFLVVIVLATPAHAKRRNRAERVLAKLWAETVRDDAKREARQLRGHEREMARDAADQRYIEDKRRAKNARSLEAVMADVREPYRK
jgi:hypothetical protein